jgi:RNA polymerase sigma factor for flagellar operon FliA
MMASTPPTQRTPDVASEKALYERYLPLVRRIAMRTVRRLPREISLDDIIGAGWLGLVEALPRGAGLPPDEFEAYASYRVRGAILDYLRSLDPLTRKLRGASRHIEETIRTLTARLGRNPEEVEIAGALGLEIEPYRALLGQIAESDAVHLEMSELVASHTQDATPDVIVSQREMVDRLSECIGKLPEKQRVVLGLYYQEECTLREIGEILGVTESRVCQIHAEAIHRLRASMGGGGRGAP